MWSAKQIGGFGGVCVGVVRCVWGGVCEVNVGRWSGCWEVGGCGEVCVGVVTWVW